MTFLSSLVGRSDRKLGLKDKLVMMDKTKAYSELVKRSNIFLMTSRLDPLPNVAIDALLDSIPVLCFEKACGIVDILKENTLLEKALVCDYYDIDMMADKTSKLIIDGENYKIISKICYAEATRTFEMEKYIMELDRLGERAKAREKQIEQDVEYLKINPDKKAEIEIFKSFNQSNTDSIYDYLLSWQNTIWPKRPIPGFHPGIYREENMSDNECADPFVHYLKSASKGEDGESN